MWMLSGNSDHIPIGVRRSGASPSHSDRGVDAGRGASAAPRAQVLSKTPAVFVVRAEGLRRSGAFSIAEVLRLALGLQEARIDAQTISARGLNGEFSNKMLIDGRSVYVTRLGGVSWKAIAYTLQRKIDNAQGGARLNEGKLRACCTPKALDKLDLDVLRGPSAARIAWGMEAESKVYFRGPEHYESEPNGFPKPSRLKRGTFVTLRREL